LATYLKLTVLNFILIRTAAAVAAAAAAAAATTTSGNNSSRSTCNFHQNGQFII